LDPRIVWTVFGDFTRHQTIAEVMDTTPEMHAGPPTTELLPESGTETTTPPTLDDARLSSLHSLEKVDTAEHPQEGTRIASGVGSSGTAA